MAINIREQMELGGMDYSNRGGIQPQQQGAQGILQQIIAGAESGDRESQSLIEEIIRRFQRGKQGPVMHTEPTNQMNMRQATNAFNTFMGGA